VRLTAVKTILAVYLPPYIYDVYITKWLYTYMYTYKYIFVYMFISIGEIDGSKDYLSGVFTSIYI
jgi:hypothetical protein